MSTKDSPKPTRSTTSTEPSSARDEARVLPIPIEKGTSKRVSTARVEPIVIILQELPTVLTDPSRPSPSMNVP